MATYGTFVNGVSLKASEANDFFTEVAFTPVLRQSNVITAGNRNGAYFQVNKLVICSFLFGAGGPGTGSNRIELDLPVTAASSSVEVIGQGFYFDAGAADPIILFRIVQFSTTRAAFLTDSGTSMTSYLGLANGPAITVANTDALLGTFIYEAA